MMPTARDIPGTVFKNGAAIFLARVVGADGLPLTPAAIASAKYSVLQLDEADPNVETPVAGHSAVTLAPGAVLLASLQIDNLWSLDAVGYNFKHVLDVSAQQAFAAAGLYYRVRYELTPAVGQVILVRFKLKAI